MQNLEKILKAVANRRRLGILKHLKTHKRASVGELARIIDLSFKSTSRHLAILKGADLLEFEQIGLKMLYSLSGNIPSIVGQIISHL